MKTFESFNLKKPLRNAVVDLGFENPTPIQSESFNVILSGKDLLGIAQTGTGKTMAYLLPLLEELKFSKEVFPRILILVPTRELVLQVAEEAEQLTKYMNVRTLAIYGGVNIKRQQLALSEGSDIIVATPGRLYDLMLSQSIIIKGFKKLIIDEVDVMLDLGFRAQLTNILELLPEKRQNIMFSATMTDHVNLLINDFFRNPTKVSIAVSGTPLENISQSSYLVKNFFTKVNLLSHLLADKEQYQKVIVFMSSKRYADLLYARISGEFGTDIGIIHSNKSQNFRLRSIEDFDSGKHRILISTDVMARGLDLDKVTHVINFDTPKFPENYMHRIGRTGRANEKGNSILFSVETEMKDKKGIENLMNYEIPVVTFPEEVELATELTEQERPKDGLYEKPKNMSSGDELPPGFHEKKEKNKKTNLGNSKANTKKKKYSKAQTRGDKTYHKKQKRG